MGGQACVFYGAAEFSRDTDFAILASKANLARLKLALAELQAELIAVPPFAAEFLRRGHALHFRCQHPEATGLRVDVMTKMRGVAPFPKLWQRRTTLTLPDGLACEILSLPDLVQAKKTQRDKDWPMLRRLVEAHYFEHQAKPTPAHVRFWLQELRTPELLCAVTARFPAPTRRMLRSRPLLKLAMEHDLTALAASVSAEEQAERTADTAYWKPLRRELETLRHARLR